MGVMGGWGCDFLYHICIIRFSGYGSFLSSFWRNRRETENVRWDRMNWNLSRSWNFISHHGEDKLVGKGQMRWSKVNINKWVGSTIYHVAIACTYTISVHPSCPWIWLHCLYIQKDRMNQRKRHKLVNRCLLFLILIFSWVSILIYSE